MTSNIFKVGADVLVNPVNCVGVAGAGLALEFRERFPREHAIYQDACHRGILRLGAPLAVHTAIESPGIIVYFPTKGHWRAPSQIEHIQTGLHALVDMLATVPPHIRSIAIPALGCGLGGLDWEQEVQPLINDTAEDLLIYTSFSTVHVLPPFYHHHVQETRR